VRIVAGRHKGRTLLGPRSNAIRPTSDRMRESLFNVLQHAYDDAVTGARVLDLFAGTGALGLEALSRGAAYAGFVDIGTEARGLIRANIEALGVAGITGLMKRDATKLGSVAPNQPFSLVFCDPPYGRALGEQALHSALSGGWMMPDALIVLEERADMTVALGDGFDLLERRLAGETQLLFARLAGQRAIQA
jgi:16S rRNA (guanine966-N2)-methyltransferase